MSEYKYSSVEEAIVKERGEDRALSMTDREFEDEEAFGSWPVPPSLPPQVSTSAGMGWPGAAQVCANAGVDSFFYEDRIGLAAEMFDLAKMLACGANSTEFFALAAQVRLVGALLLSSAGNPLPEGLSGAIRARLRLAQACCAPRRSADVTVSAADARRHMKKYVKARSSCIDESRAWEKLAKRVVTHLDKAGEFLPFVPAALVREFFAQDFR